MANTRVRVKNIPEKLRSAPQWVLWRYEERQGKRTKPPFQPNGRHASHSDAATWSTLDVVLAAYEEGGWDGIGFVLSPHDPVGGIDLDHCIDPETGELADWAHEIIERIASYTEVSPSGTGVRIFVEGKLPTGAPRGGRKLNGRGLDETGAIELYSGMRYLTVTGRHVKGTPQDLEPRENELHHLYRELFGEDTATLERVSLPSSSLFVPDHELLAQMFRSTAGPAIIALWNGDTSGYGGDDSRADAALCSHLAWWTGGDRVRIDRLFRQSRLVRDKWEREDYREATIDLALAGMADAYGGPAQSFAVEEQDKLPTLSELDAARELATHLSETLKADKGTAFAPETLRALGMLRALDRSAYERARSVLRSHRISLRDVEAALPPVSEFLPAATEAVKGVRAGDLLPDCPMPDLFVPDPYWVSSTATGTVTHDDDGKPIRRTIAFAPILITARLRDVDEGVEALRLTWHRSGFGWLNKIVDRGVALESRKLNELANDGFPVAGDNAKDLVRYLHRFEAANFSRLRCARISSHLGWQGPGGSAGFLWGRRLITPVGELTAAIQLDELPPDEWREEWIVFRGIAAGDEQIADGYHAQGTLDEYIASIAPLQHHPRVLLAFYASFVAPLLLILGAPNPIIDWSNRTSTGKTTALRVAASVWGKPDERAPDGSLGTWDSTRVWLERASYVISGMPVMLDDTKRAKTPQVVADLLYTVTQGRGRARGTTRSLARTRTWRTALLSSGEQPATSFTNDGGTRARVIVVRGIPFGRDDQETRRLVDQVNLSVLRHYGTAGPEFIRWLYSQRHRWDDFRAEYHRGIEQYAARGSEQSNVTGRIAHSAAAIDVAAACVHAALHLPWEYRDPLSELWEGIIAEAADATGELRALQDLVSWAHGHAAHFWGRHDSDGFGNTKQPHAGWAGAWERDDNWQFIAFMPDVIKNLLRTMDYEPESVLAGWAEREWLIRDGRHMTRKIGLGDTRTRMYVISREAIEEAEA